MTFTTRRRAVLALSGAGLLALAVAAGLGLGRGSGVAVAAAVTPNASATPVTAPSAADAASRGNEAAARLVGIDPLLPHDLLDPLLVLLAERYRQERAQDQDQLEKGDHAPGRTRIAPINYIVDGSRVVFRTAPGAKLSALQIDDDVALQADHYGEDSAWSVLAHGTARDITGAPGTDEVLAGLRPWVATM